MSDHGAHGPVHGRERVLDHTGNLKAAQRLLGYASIQTTVDTCVDWDIDQLAETMLLVTEDDA
jgi:site-specific recombinase XerC